MVAATEPGKGCSPDQPPMPVTFGPLGRFFDSEVAVVFDRTRLGSL